MLSIKNLENLIKQKGEQIPKCQKKKKLENTKTTLKKS